MRINHSMLIVVLFMGLNARLENLSTQSNPLYESQQVILIITKDWDTVDGSMTLYERASTDEQWRAVGEKIPIVVGRNGMAWGKGLHSNSPGDGPIKKEGDGRSPAGIFSLSSAFGYAAKAKAGRINLPYVQATATLECVDDPQSAHYNKVLDRASVKHPDWRSSEQMLRQDELYRWGVVVDHNAKGEAGCGSCIFLHIWEGPGKGTAGCTAMEAAKMEEVLRWLDAEKNPVLVQLPRAEFDRSRRVWRLP
jgi:D-alanyl-D-alanine dipeptidase